MSFEEGGGERGERGISYCEKKKKNKKGKQEKGISLRERREGNENKGESAEITYLCISIHTYRIRFDMKGR